MTRPIPTESDIPMHGWTPYHDIHRARIAAHAKHAERSIEALPWDNPLLLSILVEEVGEVARALNDAAEIALLRAEIVQVAAAAAAWIDAIDAKEEPR